MRRKIDTFWHPQRCFVSEIELEQLTGISRRTWQKHRLLSRGPRYYKIHGSVRYDLAEVMAWIKGLAAGGPEHTLPTSMGRDDRTAGHAAGIRNGAAEYTRESQ